MVRCKMVCSVADPVNKHVTLHPVYSGSEENKAFYEATPAGEVSFWVTKPEIVAKFEPGKEYFIDIAPAS